MKSNSRLRIGIIGAGASGLTTAWLLDEDHQITLFEKEDRLGGHVYTVPITKNGKTIPIEAGVEFFSDMMFGQFTKLLRILNIPIAKYQLTYTFYNTHNNQKIIFPPFHDGTISWKSLKPKAIFDQIQFCYFVNAGKNILVLEDKAITFSNFVDTLKLTQGFKKDFLYPFFAAMWGVNPEDIKQFAAYDILKWAFVNKPAHITATQWNEVVGGMNTYIDALAKQLNQTTIVRSAHVTNVAHEDNHYKVTAQGKHYDFDHLIIATDAMIAKELLTTIDHAQTLVNALGSIEYFYTMIAIHGDRHFMPANESDWSIANVRYDGINSGLTICKSWMKEAEIYRSWITYPVGVPAENPMPNPLYDLKHFYHPKVTYEYFIAQKKIAELQGTNNLWIAGFYTHDVDSHNSAIASAITIAQKLAPHSARLFSLTS